MTDLSRRSLLLGSTALLSGSVLGGSPIAAQESSPENTQGEPFRYCFNTSTIRGQKLPLDEQVRIAAEAGYQGIEPWIRDIQAFQSNGGSLTDLKKRIEDAGLIVESAIGFANWIVDDEQQRNKALEQTKREMELLKKIGGLRIAAPPAGATRGTQVDLFAAAERYGALLDVGREIGVLPQLEVWGFSENLSRLGESTLVAIESGRPDACLLPDVYHIYKGGSDFAGLNLLSGSAIHVFHMNDYPADPPRETINDAARVYPGDGVAPLSQIIQTLHRNGFQGAFSLELFNPTYWKQDPLTVAKTGLEKMKAAVANADVG